MANDDRPAWVEEFLAGLRADREERPPWVEEVVTEVRRAGKAALAARAAAESCERRLEEAEQAASDAHDSAKDVGATAVTLVEALLPTIDALARMTSVAVASAPATLFDRFRRGREAHELKALHEAVALLEVQLSSALQRAGVLLDVEVAIPFDPERHRAVETVPCRAGEPAGTVRCVRRPGVRLGTHRLREADVTVSR